MIKYLDYNGICPWCGYPFKDGIIEIHVITPPPNPVLGLYNVEYTYCCRNCENETVFARDLTNDNNSKLALAAGKMAEIVRKEVERYSKLHD